MTISRFWLSLISLLTAVILWKVVQLDAIKGERTFTGVAVSVRNVPKGSVVVNKESLLVDLKVTGPQKDIDEIHPGDVVPYVDVSRLSSGTKPFTIALDREAKDTNMYGFVWSKPTVAVTVERLVSKDVPVELEIVGSPRLQNFVFDPNASEITPEQVTVTAAKSVIKRIKRARVTIDLATVERGKVEHPPIDILDDSDAVLSDLAGIVPDTVDVLPALNPAPQTKMVFVQASFGPEQPEIGYEVWRVQAVPSQVMITGPSEELARITTLDTMPISLSGLTDTITVPAKVKLPRGVRLERPTAIRVTVNIRSTSLVSPPNQVPAVKKPSIADPQNPQP